MRKLILLLLMAGLLLNTWPTSAAPPDDLTSLARYFPDTTVVFAAVRVDNASFAAVDRLIGHLSKHIPDLIPPGASLTGALDAAIQDSFGAAGDFEAIIGSWLGDTIAIGLPSVQTAMTFAESRIGPFVIAADIDNRAVAEFFWSLSLQSPDYQIRREDDHTLFVPADWYDNPTVLIGDDVLLIAPHPSMLARLPETTLADNAPFNDALTMLPADDYGILVYLDAQGIIQPVMGLVAMAGEQLPDVSMFLDGIGVQVWGFTLLDDRSLVMDWVQQAGDFTALEEAGFVMSREAAPIDPGFAAHIPADAPLAIHRTGLGPKVMARFRNLRALGQVLQAMLREQLPRMRAYMSSDAYHLLRNLHGLLDIGHVVTFANLSFAGMTGLSLEKDLLAWMTGDYAMFLRIIPNAGPGTIIDAALAVEVTDAAAVQKVMAGLEDAIEQYNVAFNRETIDDGEAIVMPNVISALLPADVPAEIREAPELHLMIGANDQVFAVGTRAAVTFSLAPSAHSLAHDPTFVEAQPYFLEDANYIAYLNPAGLNTLADIIEDIGAGDYDAQRTAANLRFVLRLFESASISRTTNADGDSVNRFVLTLAE